MEIASSLMLKELEASRFAPRDYVEWIRLHGRGEIGNASYMLYSGLIPLKEISDSAPKGFVSFGDDFSGYNGCFSLDGEGSVHEWDSGSGAMENTGQRFSQFISRWTSAL